MGETILYAADLRGRYPLYRQLMVAADQHAATVLILGGNQFPDETSTNSKVFRNQADFLETAFCPILEDLLDHRAIKVLIHPGNRDFRHPTYSTLKKWSRAYRGRVFVVDDGAFNAILPLPVLAYPFVPPTPWPMKDWEKWDDARSEGIPEAFIKGVRSGENTGLTPVMLAPSQAGDTIAGDLEARSMSISGDYLLVAHGPPAHTSLDMPEPATHVGSESIHGFIARTQPRVSLHGHIPQSPRISGRYYEHMGRTLAVNPGQAKEGVEGECHYIVFDLDDPRGTMRHNVYGPVKRI